MVYAVRNTLALATITAVEKWILSFGIPQSIIHDRGTAFINTEFINRTKELGNTLRPRTAYSPWTNGKIETQNQHIARYWRNFLNNAGNNWSSLAPKFALAQNTSVNYTTGKTTYDFVFVTKQQNPRSLKLGLYRNKHKFNVPNFLKTSFLILIVRTSWKTNCWTIYFNRNYHKLFWKQNEPSNRFIPQPSNDAENRPHDPMLIAIASSWDTTWRYDRKYFTKITSKTLHAARNLNNEEVMVFTFKKYKEKTYQFLIFFDFTEKVLEAHLGVDSLYSQNCTVVRRCVLSD